MHANAKNTTANTWRERIITQQASGQPIRAWCQQNRCHEHSFYWWRSRLGLSPAATKRRGRVAKPVAFAKLVVEPTLGAAEPIRLSLAGGRELMLPASMPVEHIARLVRAIEGTP